MLQFLSLFRCKEPLRRFAVEKHQENLISLERTSSATSESASHEDFYSEILSIITGIWWWHRRWMGQFASLCLADLFVGACEFGILPKKSTVSFTWQTLIKHRVLRLINVEELRGTWPEAMFWASASTFVMTSYVRRVENIDATIKLLQLLPPFSVRSIQVCFIAIL